MGGKKNIEDEKNKQTNKHKEYKQALMPIKEIKKCNKTPDNSMALTITKKKKKGNIIQR